MPLANLSPIALAASLLAQAAAGSGAPAPTGAPIAPPAHAPFNWVEDFQQRSLLHLITVGILASAMLAACTVGRRCGGHGDARERRFRVAWGWFVLAYQIWYSAWYLMPYRFDWRDSLPLQLCDLAAFVAALAMITHWRVWRTLLYFWGIGLSTQAFFTPTLQYGVGHIKFYMFWIGHTMIVGSAVYDIVIGRYRPTRRDWAEGVLITYTLCMSVFLFNVVMSDWLGYPINYWYVGNTHPNAATIIDRVGPWPERVISVVVIVLTDFLLLWAVWPIAALLKGRAAPRPLPPGPG